MSVREEDRPKNCPSRGLGIAAAAIGVGVGAALYYFFNKRSENGHPDNEGSTSNWSCEQPHTLFNNSYEEDDSYSTVSEHSTSDTSIHDTLNNSASIDLNEEFHTSSEMNNSNNEYHTSQNSSRITNRSPVLRITMSPTRGNSLNMSTSSDEPESSSSYSSSSNTSYMGRSDYSGPRSESQYFSESFSDDSIMEVGDGVRDSGTGGDDISVSSQSDTENEWDVTTSSVDVPRSNAVAPTMAMRVINGVRELRSRISPRARRVLTEEDQMAMIRDQAYRERSWSLEECSICFDVMLRDQEVMALQCTHRFHQQCILPWLQEKQTCPNCRKTAECRISDTAVVPTKTVSCCRDLSTWCDSFTTCRECQNAQRNQEADMKFVATFRLDLNVANE